MVNLLSRRYPLCPFSLLHPVRLTLFLLPHSSASSMKLSLSPSDSSRMRSSSSSFPAFPRVLVHVQSRLWQHMSESGLKLTAQHAAVVEAYRSSNVIVPQVRLKINTIIETVACVRFQMDLRIPLHPTSPGVHHVLLPELAFSPQKTPFVLCFSKES